MASTAGVYGFETPVETDGFTPSQIKSDESLASMAKQVAICVDRFKVKLGTQWSAHQT
jgi:hypothetical protein